MRLRTKLLEQRPFLLKLHKAKAPIKIKSILSEASPKEIFVLCSLIAAHFGPKGIKLKHKYYKKIRASGNFSFIKKHFDSEKKLPQSSEARQYLFRIASLLRFFTGSIFSTNNKKQEI